MSVRAEPSCSSRRVCAPAAVYAPATAAGHCPPFCAPNHTATKAVSIGRSTRQPGSASLVTAAKAAAGATGVPGI
jgi:hypothetical protein